MVQPMQGPSGPSPDWVAHHAAVRPDRTAVIDVARGTRTSYAEMERRVEAAAAVLHHDAGVRAGDRVAVLSRNDPRVLEIQFACWKLGAVFVPLNWRLTGPELEFIVGDCEPRALLHAADLAAPAGALVTVPFHLAWAGAEEPDPFEAAVAAATGRDRPPVATTLDTILSVMYTSGTTGHPKGVIVTHGMTLWNVVNQTEYFRTGTDMVNLVLLPLFHTGGLNCFANPAVHYGGTSVVVPMFDPGQALGLLGDPQLGVTHVQGVPSVYQFIAQQPAFAEATFPTIVAAGVGGSAVPHALLEAWHAKGVDLQQAFGMTETGSMVMALPREDAERKRGSAGRSFLHNQLRLVGSDGRDVAPGQTGELWARGPNITPGYWNRPEETAAAISDGWLHTGDALRRDDDGYYYVVDRIKDIYISGGENVAPAEVENVIYQLEAVAEVAVVGVPDERWQEVGRAFVVVRPGAALTEADVIAHCSGRLARFKVPRSVVFLAALPRNATGKVLKRELPVD